MINKHDTELIKKIIVSLDEKRFKKAQKIVDHFKENNRTLQQEIEKTKKRIVRLRWEKRKKDLLEDKLKWEKKIQEQQGYLRLLRLSIFDVEDILAGRAPG